MDLLDALPERSAPRARLGPVTVSTADTHHVMRPLADGLVRQMHNYDPERGRNSTLFYVACRFFEYAHGGSLGQDVLEDIFAAAVNTGLTPTEVADTIESASKSV